MIPVVHLHGAVGWYFREDGTVTRLPTDEGYDDRRTPALLLPDDKKDPAGFESPARETWLQFTTLLRNSTHVFIIGHSLHDQHVVTALKESEASVAVMVHTAPEADGAYAPATNEQRKRIQSVLGPVTLIPGSFGATGDTRDFDAQSVVDWLRTKGGTLSDRRHEQ
jgi:hypothetical protein